MKRREFVEKVGMGSAALIAGGALGASAKTPGKATPKRQEHDHSPVNGDKALAVVAFGQWIGFDRFNNGAAGPNDRTKNHHVLTPFNAQIKPGGAVSFVISGFHQPTIYQPGTEPGSIDTTQIVAGSTPPGLIDDPNGRVFRGVDPRTVPQDRTENVTLTDPGKYLVICAVLPHFVNDNMYGYITVQGGDENKG